MAQSAQEKKGGPYTKNEQEDRRNEVYRLHFEHGYSAVKISQLMNINRNTINEDVKYLCSQSVKEFEKQEKGSLVLKQINRLEFSRDRLLDELDKQKMLGEKLDIEKLIFEIDNKTSYIITKAIPYLDFNTKSKLDEINEAEIKEIVNEIVTSHQGYRLSLDKDAILYDIIKFKKCDLDYAELVFAKMESLGLKICTEVISRLTYDIKKFAIMRDYISVEYFEKIEKEIEKKEKEEMEKEKEREKEFQSKYGTDCSKWSAETWEKYENEFN